MSDMEYEEKKEIADKYLNEKVGVSWDDLPDVNSLHDADTVSGIHELCDERLNEDGFPPDFID